MTEEKVKQSVAQKVYYMREYCVKFYLSVHVHIETMEKDSPC